MSVRRGGLLVVAGEASGDRIAARVVEALVADRQPLPVYGMGGPALARSGARLVADLRATSAMGTSEVFGKLPAIFAALAQIERSIAKEPPRAALLVDYTEVNLRLGRRLRRAGTRVLYCVAPQLWAWRPGRLPSVRRAVDRLAVILPFEEALFRAGGIDACYVGHPALDDNPLPRDLAREKLGLAGLSVALLPGSRPHELRATLPTMIDGVLQLHRAEAVSARLLLAPSLDPETRDWARAKAAAAGIDALDVDAKEGTSPLLPAFDAAVVTSGTATLECAVAGTPPLSVYRASRMTAFLARRLLTTPNVALPNIILGERRYPELLQEELTPKAVASELSRLLRDPERHRASASELRARLLPKTPGSFGERVARLLRPWIRGSA